MLHLEINDEIRTTAALYSLGVLPPGEKQAFDDHLAEGCTLCRNELRAFSDVAGDLASAIPEVAPPDSLRERVLNGTRPPLPPGVRVLRRSEGEWRPAPFPGISIKLLHFDKQTSVATHLVRMDPGASYPPHRHSVAEQCLVLEGDVRLDQTVLGPGDYNCNDAGSTHQTIHTKGGCVLLIIASTRDELLA